MSGLFWRSLTSNIDSKFLVKGTELSAAIVPNQLSRFVIYEVRTYDAENYPDRYYTIRDAHSVSDDQVKRGIRPKIIGQFSTEDEALAFIATAHKPASKR